MKTINLSPKKVAKAIGVSESSLKRWCDRGLIKTGKTAGGHRRIDAASVIAFLRKTDRPVVDPEILGLASTGLPGSTSLDEVSVSFERSLIEGNEEMCRRILVDLFLGYHQISEIGDRVIAPAFKTIGERWDCGSVEVFHERRACEISVRLTHELRKMIAAPEFGPVAIGATVEKDIYTLPSLLVEVVLRQQGWKAQSLGSNIPFSSMLSAISECQPKLFWLSVSHIDDESKFVAEFNSFKSQIPGNVALAVGGRVLSESIRRQISYSCYCDNLRHLETFAETLFSNRMKNPNN